MSRLRKSMARGENIGWVSRKDSNNMDRVVGAGNSGYKMCLMIDFVFLMLSG